MLAATIIVAVLALIDLKSLSNAWRYDRAEAIALLATALGVLVLGSWLLGTYLGMGLVGVWIAMACDEWLRGLMMYRRWKQRKWVKYAERTRAKVQEHKAPPIAV